MLTLDSSGELSQSGDHTNSLYSMLVPLRRSNDNVNTAGTEKLVGVWSKPVIPFLRDKHKQNVYSKPTHQKWIILETEGTKVIGILDIHVSKMLLISFQLIIGFL